MQRGESQVAVKPLSRALFLVLFGLALAVLWVVFGSTHSASAEEAPPPAPATVATSQNPSLLGAVASAVDGVVAAVLPQQPAIVTPVAQSVASTVQSTVSTVTQPVARPVSAVVAPVSQTVDSVIAAVPAVSQITGPAPVAAVTAPLGTAADDLLAPVIGPVLTDVVGPVLEPVLTPIVGPVLDTVLGPVVGSGDGATGAVSTPLLGLLPAVAGEAVTGSPGTTPAGDIRPALKTTFDTTPMRAAIAQSSGMLQPSTPSSPLGGGPGDQSVGMLSGSSSAGQTAGAGAVALVNGVVLPHPFGQGTPSAATDDTLPTSLSLDPGSSPD